MAVTRVVLVGDPLADAGACVAAVLPRGDAGRLRVAARRSAALGDELRAVSGALLDVAGSPLWRGVAQRVFVQAMSQNAPRLAATARRYDAYAVALAGYAAVLEQAGGTLPWWAREIGRRREELVALRARPVEDSAAGAAGLGRQQQVEADLRCWVRRFADAHGSWVDALEQAGRAVLAANAQDPTRDLHGWAAVGHHTGKALGGLVHPFVELAEHPSLKALSEAAGALAGDLATLGLALMVVFPPAAGACFTAATLISAAKLGTDLTRLNNGERMAATAIAVDAIDAIPCAGRARREFGLLETSEKGVGHNVARDLPDGLSDTKGVSGAGFVLLGPTSVPRRIRWVPHAEDPQWGLTKEHMAKHFWDALKHPKHALIRIDRGGSAALWAKYIQELASMPTTKELSNGVHEIRGKFPKADGSGTMKLGIRIAPRADGTFDLVTILTGQ